jgi:hypothetical protein
MHVITPSDLKKFQIEHYSKLLEKPTSEPHEKFLKQQLKLLNENNNNNSLFRLHNIVRDSCNTGFNCEKRIERR